MSVSVHRTAHALAVPHLSALAQEGRRISRLRTATLLHWWRRGKLNPVHLRLRRILAARGPWRYVDSSSLLDSVHFASRGHSIS